MRLIIALLCSTLGYPVAAAEVSKLDPVKTHEDGVINAFQIMCMTEPLDFDQLSAKAKAMRMKMTTDKFDLQSAEATRRLEIFEGNLTTGRFSLVLEEVASINKISNGCGIEANILDTEKYRANVIQRLQLKGVPEKHTLANSSELTIWKDAYGPNKTVYIQQLSGDSVILQFFTAKAPAATR
jgi:hypothetical protein